jgi:hypothetical protein
MKKTLLGILALAVCVFGFSPSAHANSLFISITGGTTTLTCDNGTALSLAACSPGFTSVGGVGSNLMLFSGFIDGYLITSLALTANVPGTPAIGFAADTKTAVANLSGGTLTVSFAAYDFSLPTGPNYALSSSQTANWISSTAGATSAFTGWARDDNGISVPGGTAAAPTPLITSPGGTTGALSSNSGNVSATMAPPYSLTGRQVITEAVGNIGSFSGNVAVTQVPEPATLLLLGAGLLGTGALGFKNRRRSGRK